MKQPKPLASLSLDLDNKWSYLKTHGDSGWESFPSYFEVLIPRVLDFLQERALTITFFVVGQDAVLEKNRSALKSLAQAGHEIGNHSFHHEPWLHLYTQPRIETELARAEEAIELATGQKPIGFRGPGFSCSEATLQVLARRGYLYDASTFPTFLGPLARAYYFMTTQLTPEEKQERKKLFGTLKDGLRPLKPYRWSLPDRELEDGLIEIPVTTMPIFKVPIHVSYVLYLSTFSASLAITYFYLTLKLCRLADVEPSILLHPLDFLGGDDIDELSFFPGMKLPGEQKLRIVSRVLEMLAKQFTVTTMQEHALHFAQLPNALVVKPEFGSGLA